jgi:hypothetical protein
VRRILFIKELMAQDRTIEEIQRQLLIRSDLDQLEQTLEKIFATVEKTIAAQGEDSAAMRAAQGELSRARAIATDLVERLERLERRLVAEPKVLGNEAAAG